METMSEIGKGFLSVDHILPLHLPAALAYTLLYRKVTHTYTRLVFNTRTHCSFIHTRVSCHMNIKTQAKAGEGQMDCTHLGKWCSLTTFIVAILWWDG